MAPVRATPENLSARRTERLTDLEWWTVQFGNANNAIIHEGRARQLPPLSRISYVILTSVCESP